MTFLSAMVNCNLYLAKRNENKSTENISTQTPFHGLLTSERSSGLEWEKEKNPFTSPQLCYISPTTSSQAPVEFFQVT